VQWLQLRTRKLKPTHTLAFSEGLFPEIRCIKQSKTLTATHCNTMQYSATQCKKNAAKCSAMSQYSDSTKNAAQCNTVILQRMQFSHCIPISGKRVLVLSEGVNL